MRVLHEAIFTALNVGANHGKVQYFNADVDHEPPYVEYWTGEGSKSEAAGFGEEGREYNIYVQATARTADEASRLYEIAEAQLKYKVLTVEGWETRGKVRWMHALDDAGDVLQDDTIVFYEGACFHIEIFRARTDV